MIALASYAKQERKLRKCPICGVLGKQAYCSRKHYHDGVFLRRGAYGKLLNIVDCLLERGQSGARLDNQQSAVLLEWGWIEKIEGTKDSFRLSKWGLEAVNGFIGG